MEEITVETQLASSERVVREAPPQGDRKGPRSAPLHSRPYKDDEKDEKLLRVLVRAGAVRMCGWDPCGRPGVG